MVCIPIVGRGAISKIPDGSGAGSRSNGLVAEINMVGIAGICVPVIRRLNIARIHRIHSVTIFTYTRSSSCCSGPLDAQAYVIYSICVIAVHRIG